MSLARSIPSSDPFDLARRRFLERLPEHFQRLTWSPEQVVEHQTAALRDLLRVAAARSPFHADRLAPVAADIDAFSPSDLCALPVMTKADMMADYDDVVTDRRLTSARVDAFIAVQGESPGTLFDEYVVLASGGSSGRRGVFTWSLDVVGDYLATILRAGLARVGGGAVPAGVSVTMVGAASAIHATRVTPHIADGVIGQVRYAPATLPTDEIVRRLAADPPLILAGYAGALRLVAEEQLAGRLAIHPAMVVSTSEQLCPETSALIAEAFGSPPANTFGSSEGLNGSATPGDDVFTFASDMAVVEFVDEHDRPVGCGTRAHHVLVTNLLNTTQPLIRYRLDDVMTEHPRLQGSGHQRATVEGRSDEVIRFGRQLVHPIAVRSVLVHEAAVAEYQVRTSERAMHVAVVATGPLDTDRVRAELTRSLADAGVAGITVSVTATRELRRDPRTGKVIRFSTDD